MGQLAVSGENQETGSILIQPANRHAAAGAVYLGQKIKHGRLLGIARGSQDATGLMQHDMPGDTCVDFLLIKRNRIAFFNMQRRITDGFPINRNASAADQLLHFLAAAKGKSGEQPVQTKLRISKIITHRVPPAQQYYAVCGRAARAGTAKGKDQTKSTACRLIRCRHLDRHTAAECRSWLCR